MSSNRFALFAIPILLAASAGPALAWTSDSGPGDTSTTSQLADPDEAIENFANPAAAAGATDLTVQPQGSGSARTIVTAPDPGNAEPVNPGWPMWMVWHQN